MVDLNLILTCKVKFFTDFYMWCTKASLSYDFISERDTYVHVCYMLLPFSLYVCRL